MEALGRLIHPVAIADGVYVALTNANGVTFSCYLAAAAGDTYTLTEAKDAAGTGAQVLTTITRYHTSNGVGGAWTLNTQAAASTVVTTATTAQNGMVVEVEAVELSDLYKYVKLTSTGAGLVHAILRDIRAPRKAANLVSAIA
jgi:hypothetical protein